jgi:hypothetical protein
LPPEVIAASYMALVWERERGMWVALIRFNRQFEAELNAERVT